MSLDMALKKKEKRKKKHFKRITQIEIYTLYWQLIP